MSDIALIPLHIVAVIACGFVAWMMTNQDHRPLPSTRLDGPNKDEASTQPEEGQGDGPHGKQPLLAQRIRIRQIAFLLIFGLGLSAYWFVIYVLHVSAPYAVQALQRSALGLALGFIIFHSGEEYQASWLHNTFRGLGLLAGLATVTWAFAGREPLALVLSRVEGFIQSQLGVQSFALGDAGRTLAVFVITFSLIQYGGLLLRARIELRMLQHAKQGELDDMYEREMLDSIVAFGGIGGATILTMIYRGVDTTGVALVSATIIGSIAYALSEVLSNLTAGVALLLEGKIEKGHYLELEGGEVVQVTGMGSRAMSFQDLDGVVTLIPNRQVFTQEIVHLSASGKQRDRIEVGIAYGTDIGQAKDAALRAARSNSLILKSPRPTARIISAGDSSLVLRVEYWIAGPEVGLAKVRASLLEDVLEAFQHEHPPIEVPFPQLVVHRTRGDE